MNQHPTDVIEPARCIARIVSEKMDKGNIVADVRFSLCPNR